MKVCGLIGSPIKDGNVDLLVSQVLAGARSQGAETLKLYLNDMDIRPCQSCGVDPAPHYCLFDDDMALIFAALESCDALVLGSPVYFGTVSAQVKLMIDRCNCLVPYVQQADGTFEFERRMHKRKVGVFVAVAGARQDFRMSQRAAKAFFNWANAELVETILHGHDDNELGSVRHDAEKMVQAHKAGVQLVG
jgi:multimeric flavodoxin WrbA